MNKTQYADSNCIVINYIPTSEYNKKKIKNKQSELRAYVIKHSHSYSIQEQRREKLLSTSIKNELNAYRFSHQKKEAMKDRNK